MKEKGSHYLEPNSMVYPNFKCSDNVVFPNQVFVTTGNGEGVKPKKKTNWLKRTIRKLPRNDSFRLKVPLDQACKIQIFVNKLVYSHSVLLIFMWTLNGCNSQQKEIHIGHW